jgi:hypothetical protein
MYKIKKKKIARWALLFAKKKLLYLVMLQSIFDLFQFIYIFFLFRRKQILRNIKYCLFFIFIIIIIV